MHRSTVDGVSASDRRQDIGAKQESMSNSIHVAVLQQLTSCTCHRRTCRTAFRPRRYSQFPAAAALPRAANGERRALIQREPCARCSVLYARHAHCQ